MRGGKGISVSDTACSGIRWERNNRRVRLHRCSMMVPGIVLVYIAMIPMVGADLQEGGEVGLMASLAAGAVAGAAAGAGAAGVWLQQLLQDCDGWKDWDINDEDGDGHQHSDCPDEIDWVGGCLPKRVAWEAGLRVACFNAQKRLFSIEGTDAMPHMELLMQEFQDLQLDVLVVQEPGEMERREHVIKSAAIAKGCEAVTFGDGRSGGCVVMTISCRYLVI